MADEQEQLMTLVTGHAVPSFDDWYKVYQDLDQKGFHKSIGLSRCVVSRSKDAEGRDYATVVHYFPKKNEQLVREKLNFSGPPFVGGPDLIANGLVIPPITEKYSTIVCDHAPHEPEESQ